MMKKWVSYQKSHRELTLSGDMGVCLGGGGALGFAHVGVLQALEEHGIYPAFLSGTSMGAIIGTIYAAGFTPDDMLQLIRQDKLYKITKLMTFRRGFPHSGFSTHSMLRSLIREMIPHNSFEQLERKMHICVTNLTTGEWEIKDSGKDLDKWVAASASIPGVFEAVRHRNAFYVDGGILNNLPTNALMSKCNTVFAVDVMPLAKPDELKRPTDSITASVRAMLHQNSLPGRELCHHLIEPRSIDSFHEFSFESFQRIYEMGYEATMEYLSSHPV